MTHMVKIHCNVIHPASGEVIAEAGETLKASNPRALRVLALVIDYPEYFSYQREGETTHISEYKLEGCPTDEEIQLAQDAADQEEEEYVPLVEFIRGWKEGRGYGDSPKEGL